MRRVMAVAALVCLAFADPLFAQADRTRQWLAALSLLNDPSAAPRDRRQAELVALRQQIADWLALNRETGVDLPAAPPVPWTEDQVEQQLAALRQTIDQIAARDPNQPFYLGVTAVNVTAPLATLSPVTDSLDRVEIQNHQALTVNQVIEYLPGVSVDHKAPRNQTGISIGGFDSRQVPLYLDGIPAYVPFDGYVDLTRYLTSDVAEVQVAKGYSSPLLGPNLLGGVVNVVTRQPQKTFEGDAFIGTAPGNQLDTGVHVGSRWRTFFVQASADRLQSDFYPLSGSFTPTGVQRDDRRLNSDQHDDRYRLRAAWTPRASDQYVFSYANQDGQTGIPPYSGIAPACPSGNATLTTPCVTPKFWKWPYWNTDSYYFNSNTALGSLSTVQVRAFYIGYSNRMDMFDAATYSSMNQNASSGMTNNDDHSVGVSGEFETRVVGRNTIGASFFVKNDTHTEQTTTFSRANVAATTPLQTDRDRQSSFGIRDVVMLSTNLRATVGVSADQLNGLEAQDLSSDRTHVVPFQVTGICTATPGAFDSCTDHAWTYNPVAALTYTSDGVGTLFVTFAHKSRFPTIKDRYSYKAGRAVPNPLLDPERARTWTAGYARTIAARTVAQIDLFRSDVRDEIENIFFLSPLCASGGRGGVGSCQQAVNVGSELHDGVNVTVRTTAIPQLIVDGNYSFLHREIRDVSGVFPTGTPTHKAVATATARLPYGATALVSARHEGGIVAMSDNGLPLPVASFTTVDVGGRIPIRSGISVQAGVKNLLDANYYYWEGFPEAGRAAYVTIRYAF
jgi:iron complex outermembrane receptor protein